MAIYATVEEVKSDVPDSPLFEMSDETYDEVLGAMLSAASRLIDKYVGGFENCFYPTTDAQTRYFDGNGEEGLWIDPLLTITTVSVSEGGGRSSTSYTDWTLNTDYYAYPYNSTPYEKLLVDNDAGSKGNWGTTSKGVKITGVWGYALTPPADIKQACKIQAMRWFMRAKQGYQDAGASATLGQMIYAQELDPDVKMLLAPYRLHNAVSGW